MSTSPQVSINPALLPVLTGLSNRQRQLIELLGYGLTNKEISARSGLTEDTVKVYLHRIRQKWPHLTRHGAVRIAVRDHERKQAIRLSEWIKEYGESLNPGALASIRAIMADVVADCLR